jgi:hypothetical protein
MKGASADPVENMISMLIKRRILIRGKSQNFFLVFKNAQSSLINSLMVTNLKGVCEI